MEHLNWRNSGIINELYTFPITPRLIVRRKQVFILVMLVIFAFFKSELVEAQRPGAMAPSLSEIKKDASQRTVRLEFKLDRIKAKETVIYFSSDSAALLTPSPDTRSRPAVFDEAGQVFRVEFDGLEPDSPYYYRIFMRDRQNKIIWSEITSIHTPGFNIRWSGAQKWLPASNTTEIMLTGESVDTVPGNYQVFLGGKPGELLRIKSIPNSVRSSYVIRLPRNTSPGRHRLVMVYKQKKIFEGDIDVL
jgi:hypothetical protein